MILGWIAIAFGSPPILPTPHAGWTADQVIGPPNAKVGTDDPHAWAPALEEGGPEWLEVEFDDVAITEIRIVESFNPGAVSSVSIGGRVVWKGTDPTDQPGPFVVPMRGRARGTLVRIELDTTRVPGWNEIDAVGAVDTSGKVHWASAARASSHFGQRTTTPHPLASVRGRQVTLQLRGGSTITGVLEAIDGDVLMVREGDRTTLVFQQAVDAVSY